MPNFDFPYHKVTDEYPESSIVLRFGRGYQFASKPRGPDQLIFHLEFPVMYWYFNGTTIDRTVKPQLNFAFLQDFYESVRMYDTFTYTHPSRGVQTVRFQKPLPPVKGITNAVIYEPTISRTRHAIDAFNIDLIQQP